MKNFDFNLITSSPRGSFSNGDGISRDGTGLVEYTDIVLVSVNYRLQMLGFMNYYEGIPSNLGLWDIVLALEWVQEHVGQFGGDKDKVVVYTILNLRSWDL